MVTDNPIGDSINSDTANTAMMAITTRAGTVRPVVAAIGRNSRNATPIPMTP